MAISFYIRIEAIAKKYGISTIELGRRLGYGDNPAKLYRLKDESKSPSIQIIQDILKVFPDVNAKWLLTGEEGDIIEEPKEKYGFCKECIKKEGIIEFLKKECVVKDKIIEQLKLKGVGEPREAGGQTLSGKQAS